MKPFLQTTWKAALSFLFGITVFIFWVKYYPAHLSFQEQYQLFLFDTVYFWERVSVPGGLADYIAEFLTQFYYHPWIGACILAFLYVTLQLCVWSLAKKQEASDVYYPLSFIPAIALWRYMGDENVMLSFTIALLMALMAAYVYTRLQRKLGRICYVIATIPILYWTAGAAHFTFMGWLMLYEFINHAKERDYFRGCSILMGVAILGFLCPLLAKIYLQYPLYRLMGGINYYRFPAVIPKMGIIITVLLAVLPSVMTALPHLQKRKATLGVIQVFIIGVCGYFFIGSGCDMNKEETMDYDHKVRNQQWNAIIQKARKKSPPSPFTMTCLNLALGKTNQLSDRMFEFGQKGVEGLLPKFQLDFASPLPASEAYYHLGMINTAQQFAFEALEAIPNFRLSGRLLKRLVETNLINGRYEVAAKYLRALKKTLFYKGWAEDTMTYLRNEAKIDAHKEWGRLRKLRYTEDFLFSEQETDMMLGLLYERDYTNRMAFEYLLAYVLLEYDLERFKRFYPLGKHAGYNHIPRSYQEALIYTWMQTHNNFQGVPWSISREVLQNAAEFARFYTSQPNNLQAFQTRFGDTYWYYLLSK